jgi:prolyl 4-hydroxylase
MVSLEDRELKGGGRTFCLKIWDAARDILEEWTGQELAYSSIYGIRVYKEGAILAPHVDRLPLVSSAIINVAQDVDQPWPLEVIGHDGKATNVTMEPGDMVLYESHSIIHGRPFPLKGRFMANLFVHFEPTGHPRRSGDIHEEPTKLHDPKELPPYIIPESPAEAMWWEEHPDGRQRKPVLNFLTGSSYAHYAAKEGAIDQLLMEIEKDKDIVHKHDNDGHTPLHIAVNRGNLDVVQVLIEHGADHSVHKQEESGKNGGTPLWWAKQKHGSDHPVVTFLEEIGSLEAGPEL